MRLVLGLVMIPLLAAAPAAAAADTEKSPALAAELTQLMAGAGLDAVAAVDPETPERFVAVLAFPKVQFLVISAKYPAPTLMLQQIAAKQYKDAYMALQQAGLAEGKFFLQDMGANGLHASGDDGVDVLYENVVKQTLFDGSPDAHKMSKAEYAKRFAAADAVYSRLLGILIAEVKTPRTP